MSCNFKLAQNLWVLAFFLIGEMFFKPAQASQAYHNPQSYNYAPQPQAAPLSGSMDIARLQSDLFQMQEQMRVFQGQLDELRNILKQFENYLKVYSNDVNSRFEGLEKNKLPSAPQSSETSQAIPAITPPVNQGPLFTNPKAEAGLPEGEAQRKYAYAQQLFQERNFLGAEATLKELIEHHPNDPLVVNAYYWLAEISFVKKDYGTAAVGFGEAFEAYQRFSQGNAANQASSKAPEILLKMALSLKELGKFEDAKLTLAQIKKSFPHMTADVKHQVEALNREFGSR